MVEYSSGKRNTFGKRRNPFWLSARGVNLGTLGQKSSTDIMWDDDGFIEKDKQ